MPFETILQDARYAFRTLRRSPGFTIAAGLTLAMGIGANVAMFSVINSVLLTPLPYDEPGRVVRLLPVSQGRLGSRTSLPNIRDWGERATSLAAVSPFQWRGATLLESEPTRVGPAGVWTTYFNIVGVRPAIGRFFTPDDHDQFVVVLSHAFWLSHFGGDPGVVGSSLNLDGDVYAVIGVTPTGFVDPFAERHMYVPRVPEFQRGTWIFGALARLSPGVTLEDVQRELDVVSAAMALEIPENKHVEVRAVSAQEVLVGDVSGAMVLLFVAVVVVLTTACVNVANLFLSRAAGRAREIAIRRATGAGPARVFRQLLTESVLLGIVGGTGGVAIAVFGTRGLAALGTGLIPRANEIVVNGPVLVFALAVSLGTGLLFGLVPALNSARGEVLTALREGGRGSTGARSTRRLRGGLVIAEVALSVVLLIGAGLLVRSLWKLQQVDTGVDLDGAVVFTLSPSDERYPDGAPLTEFYRQVLEELEAIPGVAAATAANVLPLNGETWNNSYQRDDLPPPAPGEPTTSADVVAVTTGYFQTLGIPVRAGRLLTETDVPSSPFVAVISRTMAEHDFAGVDPIGMTLTSNGTTKRIVGIVENVLQWPNVEPAPTIYTAYAQEDQFWMRRTLRLVVRATGDPLLLAPAIRETIWDIDETLPVVGLQRYQEVAAERVAGPRFRTLLLTLFAGLAITLAGVGISGVIAYNVSQRRHEIGVRVALGAARRSVTGLVVGQGMKLTLVGVGLGVLGAIGTTRLLETFLFGVQKTDPMTFVGASATLAVVALAASYLPARRASRLDPMTVLREE